MFVLSKTTVIKSSDNLVESTYLQLISLITFGSPVTIDTPNIVENLKAVLLAGNYYAKPNPNFDPNLSITKVNMHTIAEKMRGCTEKIISFCPNAAKYKFVAN